MSTTHEHTKDEERNHSLHNGQAHHAHTEHPHAENVEKADKPEDDPKKSVKSMISMLVIVGIIVVILAVIVFVSRYGKANSNTIEYNHYVFEKFEGSKWMTQQLIRNQLYNIPFYYNPLQVEDIPVDPASVDTIRAFSLGNSSANGTVYISVSPNESSRIVLAGVEYARILGTVYNMYNLNVKSAIHNIYNSTVDIPIITCKNQSENTLVIYAVVTDKNLVSVHGNCILIESTNATESIRVADAFSFRLLNIMTEDTLATHGK